MKIFVPIDESDPSTKALEYAIYPLKLTNPNTGHSRKKHSSGDGELILIKVLAPFHTPLGFEKPMKSVKPNQVVSLSQFIEEMNQMI